MAKVTFVEGGKTVSEVEVPAGTVLRTAARENGIPIHHEPFAPPALMQYVNCMGMGSCGTCHVMVKKGMENLSAKGLKEKIRLFFAFFAIGHEKEVRLACQAQVQGDVEVEIHPPMNLYGERFWE